MTSLKSTPLLEMHRKLKARIVPFAGWNMPIQYEGVIPEHQAVRNGLGVFDVSHMGEVEIKGAQAGPFLQRLMTNDIDKLDDGGIIYSLMCYENGGVIDDLLIHRFSEDHYFLCVNASNTDKDFEWIASQTQGFDVSVDNTSDRTAQLAVQGSRSEALLQPLSDVPLADLNYYRFKQGKIASVDCIIARTGYTGEDGFELYLPADQAVSLMETLMEAGEPLGLKPIGLGARDTLRLEMGYALYGQEISADHLPWEARLGWVINTKKKDSFIGQDALLKQKEDGVPRKLVALKLTERGVPRSHYRILHEGQPVGEVTSGTFSPSLNQGIALGYVPPELAQAGNPLAVEIRNKTVPAEVVGLPFVPSRVKKNN